MSSSQRFQASAGRSVALFSHKRKSSQESHTDRDDRSLALRAVQGENEALLKLSESENQTSIFLEEQRDQFFSEAKAEIMTQECRAEFADSNIRELHRQIQSQRMEIDHAKIGYEQSRRDQARLHEELAKRQRALRETHIRGFMKWKN